MFSYRHAFHAGNHADVLKHLTLIAVLRHLMLKPTGLTLIDTHAGAGLYRLDSDFSRTGGEAADGIVKLIGGGRPAEKVKNKTKPPPASVNSTVLAPDSGVSALADYLELITSFNSDGALRVYPGSPFVMYQLLRAEARDKLRLFELHPTDSKLLAANIAQLDAGRQIQVTRQDGFEGLKALLPPPNKRALVLIDPSYEIKTDYAKVVAALREALERFADAVVVIWYPQLQTLESQQLPRRLQAVADAQAKRGWLHGAAPKGVCWRALCWCVNWCANKTARPRAATC